MGEEMILLGLLPGRLLPLRLDPFSLTERVPASLEEAFAFGSLPGIALAPDDATRATSATFAASRRNWACRILPWLAFTRSLRIA